MIELDTKFCDVIVKRWEEFTGKEAILASDNKSYAAMRSSGDTLQLARKLMRESWNRTLEFEYVNQGSVEDQIRQAERKIDQLIDRITETDSTTLMGAYEAKLKKLEIDKVMLQEKIAKCGTYATRL